MSDLAKKSSRSPFYITINFLFTVINLWLFYHLFSLSYRSGFKPPPIAEFIKYRNLFYQVYLVIFILVGLFEMPKIKREIFQQKSKNLNKQNLAVDSDFPIFFNKLILSLILTTFSYVIVGLGIDVINLISKLFKF